MSEPWFASDDASAAAGGGRMHALVVGTSFYQYLPDRLEDPPLTDKPTLGLTRVTTPAIAAYGFARWLRDSYHNPRAPLASVRLLLSPSEREKQAQPELAALGPSVLPATRDNVLKAVNRWARACGSSRDNVAVLYAGGHGVQMTIEDGGIVLLEDFAAPDDSVLAGSLNIASVKRGMAGPTMAKHQFYFVDACRIRPEEFAKYSTMVGGVGLDGLIEDAPECAAVYFSAAPSTLALGDPGNGTLFGEALLDCLKLHAVESDRDGRWLVTSLSLIPALKSRVSELAQKHGERQETSAGGLQLAEVPFHVLSEPPLVPLTLVVDPETAAACAFATLHENETNHLVFEREPFAPLVQRNVKPGLYQLGVTIEPQTPPYVDTNLAVVAAPPPQPPSKVRVIRNA